MSINNYHKTLDFCKNIIDFYSYLVEEFGVTKVLTHGITDKDHLINTYHDYIYYCFTKSTRSILASIKLSDSYLREDSLIILRTVYENYLRLAHTLNDPNKINEYVIQTVGLSTGLYSYKKRNNGTLNYKQIVDSRTLEELSYGTSTSTMAKYSFNSKDISVHNNIYHYLSEHTHPNMMASGNYRITDKNHYSVDPVSISLEVPFFALYLTYILGDALYYYHTNINKWNLEGLTLKDFLDFTRLRKNMQDELLIFIELLEFDKLPDKYRNLLIERVTYNYDYDDEDED